AAGNELIAKLDQLTGEDSEVRHVEERLPASVQQQLGKQVDGPTEGADEELRQVPAPTGTGAHSSAEDRVGSVDKRSLEASGNDEHQTPTGAKSVAGALGNEKTTASTVSLPTVATGENDSGPPRSRVEDWEGSGSSFGTRAELQCELAPTLPETPKSQ